MIDYLSLALAHALLVLAFLRLAACDDLDVDPAFADPPAEGARADGVAGKKGRKNGVPLNSGPPKSAPPISGGQKPGDQRSGIQPQIHQAQLAHSPVPQNAGLHNQAAPHQAAPHQAAPNQAAPNQAAPNQAAPHPAPPHPAPPHPAPMRSLAEAKALRDSLPPQTRGQTQALRQDQAPFPLNGPAPRNGDDGDA